MRVRELEFAKSGAARDKSSPAWKPWVIMSSRLESLQGRHKLQVLRGQKSGQDDNIEGDLFGAPEGVPRQANE